MQATRPKEERKQISRFWSGLLYRCKKKNKNKEMKKKWGWVGEELRKERKEWKRIRWFM